MGWEGTHIMTRPGVWVWSTASGAPLGVAAIWWGTGGGTPVVNEFRVNKMMDQIDEVRITLDPNLPMVQGQDLNARRNHFKNVVWPAYVAAYSPNTAGWVAREWRGLMTEDQGFDLSGGSSTTYNGGETWTNQI